MSCDYIGVLGGLALFLYGMKMMSDGMEGLAGNHLGYVLERLTDKKIKAVIVGIVVTALIQSSSAMTVLLIGCVNGKLMDLKRAIWVVMGANIGTTITGQMLTLDIGKYAPFLAIIGVVLILTSTYQQWGESIGGIGLLFMGLEMMSIALAPLKNESLFLSLLTYVSHPIFGICIGALFTGIIQSSSASIGVLQALSKQGLLTLSQATYLIFGFDIGTCVTGLIASLSADRCSQQLALFHLLLNIFGACVFTFITLITPFISFVSSYGTITNQIANMHTLLNIGTTIIVFIIDEYLLRIVYWILPKND